MGSNAPGIVIRRGSVDVPPFVFSDEVKDLAEQLGEEGIGRELYWMIRRDDAAFARIAASTLPSPDNNLSVGLMLEILEHEDARQLVEFVVFVITRARLRQLIEAEVNAYLSN